MCLQDYMEMWEIVTKYQYGEITYRYIGIRITAIVLRKIPGTTRAFQVARGHELRASGAARMHATADTTADLQNFGKMLLVFGCIGTDLCK